MNINNGSRIITYAIPAERGSGTIMLNGAAARTGMVGDIVVIMAYANVDERDLGAHNPALVFVDAENKITK